MLPGMNETSGLLGDFERACRRAGIAPTEALKAGGVHHTLWRKWTELGVNLTVRNLERAYSGLEKLRSTDKP